MHFPTKRFLLLPLLALALLAPAGGAAAAELQTFVATDDLYPSGDANGTFGPANEYPSTITVSGVPGTVVGVTVEVIDLASGRPEDIDMALVGPDGSAVMLMSDACGGEPGSLVNDDWTFDDAAPTFLSSIGCTSRQTASFKPTNYFNESQPDELGVEGGPTGPYLNTLAALTGGSAEGAWKLYVLDDSTGTVGFGISGWVLRLEVEPPPPIVAEPPPVTPATPAPGGSPAVTPPAPVAGAVAPVAVGKTGRRAKALARCAKLKAHKARRSCRVRAHKLPR